MKSTYKCKIILFSAYFAMPTTGHSLSNLWLLNEYWVESVGPEGSYRQLQRKRAKIDGKGKIKVKK